MEQGNKRKMIPLRLTDQERARILERMKQAGFTQIAVYARKMALDGYILVLDLPELKELISLCRYSSNNINQIARKANGSGEILKEELMEIQEMQEKIWNGINKILKRLGEIP